MSTSEKLVTRRTTCRACGGEFVQVISLGEQHLQGAFLKPWKVCPELDKVPMNLMLCQKCGLLQLEHTVRRDALYSSYWYESRINQTMRDHLKGISEESCRIYGKQFPRVLDIGCNDGTLLDCYPGGCEKIGIDPSVRWYAAANTTHIRDYFPSDALKGMKFEIITSIAMFYDVEDPVAFARAVKELLAPDGIWVIEVAYLPEMLQNGAYDTICAEHLEYYSLHSLRQIMMWSNLWPFRASLNSINGGSVRVYVTHSERFNHESLETDYQLFDDRHAMNLGDLKPYLKFQDRIEGHRDDLQQLMGTLSRNGKRIHAYGASTKGNTILEWCGLDNIIIDFIADRNPQKWGARTLGSDIPIISEEESRAMRPDYYLVLPWHFEKEFIKRERETIMNGTRMIFPLPEIKLVGKDDLL